MEVGPYQAGRDFAKLKWIVLNPAYQGLRYEWDQGWLGRRAVVVRNPSLLDLEKVAVIDTRKPPTQRRPHAELFPTGLTEAAFQDALVEFLNQERDILPHLANVKRMSSSSDAAGTQVVQAILVRKAQELGTWSPGANQSWPCASLIVQTLDGSRSDDGPVYPNALEAAAKDPWYPGWLKAMPQGRVPTVKDLRNYLTSYFPETAPAKNPAAAATGAMPGAAPDATIPRIQQATHVLEWARPYLEQLSMEAW
jgi:hypothetical protein